MFSGSEKYRTQLSHPLIAVGYNPASGSQYQLLKRILDSITFSIRKLPHTNAIPSTCSYILFFIYSLKDYTLFFLHKRMFIPVSFTFHRNQTIRQNKQIFFTINSLVELYKLLNSLKFNQSCDMYIRHLFIHINNYIILIFITFIHCLVILTII